MRLPFRRKPRPGPVARIKAGVEQMHAATAAALCLALLALAGVLILAAVHHG